jgi:hypothetical protein
LRLETKASSARSRCVRRSRRLTWASSLAGPSCSAALVLCSAALGTAAPVAAADACPNEAIRATQTSEVLPTGTTYLPNCMALEMVSPPKKLAQEAGELAAFSTDGNRVLFKSKAALAGTPGQQAFVGDSYVASRGAGGWATTPTTAPAAAQITVGGNTAGGPYAFAPDLGCWTLFGATQRQKSAGEGQIFDGCLGGAFAALSPVLVPIDDSSGSTATLAANFASAGTAADLSATVFLVNKSSTAYLSGDPRSDQVSAEAGAATNSYLAFHDSAGQPALQLLARDKAGVVYGGRCGSTLGSNRGGLNQGAISADGSRIYFSTRLAQPPSLGSAGPPCSTANPLRILERTDSGEGPEIASLLPGAPADWEAPGDDLFQGASVDGSRVFFNTPRKLAASDQDSSSEACSSELGASKGCDLYLYDADLPTGERLVQVSAGGNGDPTPGQGANVLNSVLAISSDGSHAYFAAQGVLTTDPSPAGAVAQLGQPNLYLYRRDAAHPGGETAFIGTLAAADQPKSWGKGMSFLSGAYAVPLLAGAEGGDGHVLFLVSRAPLSGNDADGARADVFRYDAGAATLQCVSCAPGGPDAAPFDASAGFGDNVPSSNFAEQGRWASEDGQTVAFATPEPLSPGDLDFANNPYLWRAGQLVRLPGKVGEKGFEQEDQLPVLSASGEEVGFSTDAPLLPQDGDTARDAYLVRAGGGFPNPAPPLLCDPLSEGSCQGPASRSAPQPGTATDALIGPGNRKAVPSCRRGQVRSRGKCVKRHQRKKSKHHRRASHERGGKK